MRTRLAPVIALAITASVAAGGCGSHSKKQSSMESARPFANGFAHRLVAVGRWYAIEGDVSPAVSRQMRDFQKTIRRNGMRAVSGNGALRHDCPANANVGAGKDCFVYIVSGKQVLPVQGVKTLRARFRLWVSHQDGAWQVISYDYDLFRGV